VQRANKAIVASWKGRPGRVRPRAVDVGLAVAVAVAVAIAIDVSRYSDPSTRPPDAFAYALAATLGALLLGRRRWPLGVLIVSVVTLQVYHFAGYPGISAAVPLAVALYTAAAAGHLRWSLGIAAVYLAGLLLYAVLWYPGPPGPVLDELVRDGALLAAVLLFGDAVRSHRALMAESYERLRREARELSAARVIQQQLLPRELPSLPGWRMAAYYRPAREVGGDFYDLLELPNGQLVLVSGDATDKGIPAALVMATTHSILRGEAPRLVSAGAVLEQANDRLYPDIPAHMFVTCLYAVLDPTTGRLRYANAGHNLPCVATADGVTELRARGMPLGAMPGMRYEENEIYLAPGESVLFYSDGLVEAHDPRGEMFGFPRLRKVVENSAGGDHLIKECLAELEEFAGDGWEQEDDITLVTLERTS
jgi:serine phosphatase RsbU (regulator of sigma subunit)